MYLTQLLPVEPARVRHDPLELLEAVLDVVPPPVVGRKVVRRGHYPLRHFKLKLVLCN